MVKEQERHPADPPIVNPIDFLAKPFERLEVGELLEPPNLNFLQWLPTLKEETGLVCRGSRWFVIKASERGVPAWLMPQNSDLLIHSHPGPEETNDPSLPSIGDYHNCSPTAKNFIVSRKGLTQYWSIEGKKNKQALSRMLCAARPEWPLLVLNTITAKFSVYPWEALDEEKLSKLFDL